MRKVRKDFDAVPNCLQTPSCEAKRLDALRNKNKHAFDGPYGDKEVKDALEVIYLKKCAYCEGGGKETAPFQVDHYRPKKGVKNDPTHIGYYWLAYEWSNLILACSNCNRHKSTYFPTAQKRVSEHPILNGDPEAVDKDRCRSASADLLAEGAYIINPEIDDNPAAHFAFGPTGMIGFKTEAGRRTIDVCDLARPELVIKRKEIYDEVLKGLLIQCKAYDNQRINEQQLDWGLETVISDFANRVNDESKPYTACARTLWTHFERIFIDNLSPQTHQDRLRRIYKK